MSPAETPLAERLLIVGAGLIGSSIAHDARRRRLAGAIMVLDCDAEVVKRVRELRLADQAETDPGAFDGAADLAVLATPVRAMGPAAQSCAKAIRKGGVVFDTGSVKGRVIADASEAIAAAGAHFVPAHPIAGTERSGPDAGFAGLFDGKWCVLTPPPDANEDAVTLVERFWAACGSRTARMPADEHDALLAVTSHAPHLIAYAMTAMGAGPSGRPSEDVVRYSAGGFRDFTRIAASDPVMWRDVFLSNREPVLAALDRFEAEISALRAAVAAGDGPALEARFTATRAVRAAIVAAGQETAAADFGREHPEPEDQ